MDYFPHQANPLAAVLRGLERETAEDRQALHRRPELSLHEDETSAFLRRKVEALGLPYDRVGDYGLLVRLEGTGQGPDRTVLLRADIDALPVQEEPCNLAGPKAAVSEHPGVSHACGHDAHTAMLLASMKALWACRDSFAGRVLFCFEQAEEVGGGVVAMLKALEPYPVDRAWGIHVYAGLAAGALSVDPGPRMAGIASFCIRITGRGGHASRPDLCNSPILCGAQLISILNSQWAGVLNPTKTVTLGIANFNAGTKANVIPDTADIAGSLRFFDMEEGQRAYRMLKETAVAAAALYRCTVEFPVDFEYPFAVRNDPECAALAARAAEEVLGPGHVVPCEPWFATDSMALYLAKYPGVYAFLGIQNEAKGTGAGHHTAQFDVDDDVLKLGVGATVNFALHALTDPQERRSL